MKQFEICDGFVLGDKISFRLPLRGLAAPYLSPTKLNVFNKFSVKYFVQLKVIVRKEMSDDGESEYGLENESKEEHEDPV
jgi:hypothetical protein